MKTLKFKMPSESLPKFALNNIKLNLTLVIILVVAFFVELLNCKIGIGGLRTTTGTMVLII